MDRQIRSAPEFQWERPNSIELTERDLRIRCYMFWLMGWADVPEVDIHRNPELFKLFKYDRNRIFPEQDTISIKELARELGLHFNTIQDYTRGPRWGKLNGEMIARGTDPLKAESRFWLLIAPRNLPPIPMANLRRVVREHAVPGAFGNDIQPPNGILRWDQAQLMNWVLYGIEPSPPRNRGLKDPREAPTPAVALATLGMHIRRIATDEGMREELVRIARRVVEVAAQEPQEHPENQNPVPEEHGGPQVEEQPEQYVATV